MEYINRFYWLIALCLIISTGANASVNPKPFVIPELKEWKGSDGTFVPTECNGKELPATLSFPSAPTRN